MKFVVMNFPQRNTDTIVFLTNYFNNQERNDASFMNILQKVKEKEHIFVLLDMQCKNTKPQANKLSTSVSYKH